MKIGEWRLSVGEQGIIHYQFTTNFITLLTILGNSQSNARLSNAMKKILLLVFISLLITGLVNSCKKDENNCCDSPPAIQSNHLTIFTVNDLHAQLDNFSRIKYIVEQEEQSTNVLLVSGGDIFSGNPVVDNYPDKGFPVIDIMNQIGFDITVIGNHDFDYGVDVLGDRMAQSDIKWVCANLDQDAALSHTSYQTLVVDDIKVTFLGLVETYGKPDGVIPSTHPWKVEGLSFQTPWDVVGEYASLKETEQSDLYIALTHIGEQADFTLAEIHPYFDLIIGGHSHWITDTVVNGIPVFRAGSYLNYLGKINIEILDAQVQHVDYELINLDEYSFTDTEIESRIDQYNANMPELEEVIGNATMEYDRYTGLGCFYTDAMRIQMGVDVNFQNTGGLRNILDEGSITRREIYEITPFNNGTIIYDMTVSEIKTFLSESGAGFFYSGIIPEQQNEEIIIKNPDGNILDDQYILRVGINDYIPAVYDMYFPPQSSGEAQPYTDAETIIMYLLDHPEPVNYTDCVRYFRYSY